MEPQGRLQSVGGFGVLYQVVCAGRGGKVLHSVPQNLSLMKKEAAKDEVAASDPSPGSAVLGQMDRMRSSLGFPQQGEHICFLATQQRPHFGASPFWCLSFLPGWLSLFPGLTVLSVRRKCGLPQLSHKHSPFSAAGQSSP